MRATLPTVPVVAVLVTFVCGACGSTESSASADATSTPMTSGAPSSLADRCDADNAGLVLPDGFCAMEFHPGGAGARHLDVRDDGSVFVAVPAVRRRGQVTEPGGILVLQDRDGDGRADTETWLGRGVAGGNEVLLDGETVWVAPNDAVLRYTLPADSTSPTEGPDTVVQGLPTNGNHTTKSVALGPGGALFVDIGSASNACQEQPRTAGSPGRDPCRELETRAGVWRFDPERTGQTQADGRRFATGLRNVVALRTQPGTGALYGVQHGRDQLHDLFPDLFSVEQSAEKPAEELVRIEDGDDFGWPYCYYDPATETLVLAPEYGGDGAEVGRCAEKKDPLVGFPAHWAPDDLEFYTGSQFPTRYQGGAFIAFHGSWNRAPLPQEGYNVVFLAFRDGQPTTDWEVFANGFRPEPTEGGAPQGPSFRPVGVAMGPDGSLYVSESQQGRIWRIVYRGT